VGHYGPLGTKSLVVRDIEIAKHILVKDFDHFVDRRPIELNHKTNKYFLGMLVMMSGEKWKIMRGIVSPVFTSGKLKSMMPIIHKVNEANIYVNIVKFDI
jgi:cytochrome P450